MSRTILLADDSLAIQKVVKLTFETTDIDVEVVGSGDEALRELSRIDPVVVIADVHMPGATGYDVARQVKAERPDTPVLLLVGTFEAFDDEECAASGADGHMLKPFESAELRERIESLVRAAAPERPGEDSAEEMAEGLGDESPSEEPQTARPRPEPAASDSAVADDDTRPVEPVQAEGAGDSRTHSPEAPGEGVSSEEGTPPEVALSETEAGAPSEAATDRSEASDGVTTPGVAVALDSETIEHIARRVVEMISAEQVERIAREVVPRVAEEAVRRRIEELERDVD